MLTSFMDAWNAFCGEIESRNRRLSEALSRSCQASNSLLQELAQNFNAWVWRPPEPGRLAAFETLAENEAEMFLRRPLLRLERSRPQQTVLSAIEDYKSGVEDALRLLPQKIEISGKDLLAALQPADAASWRRALAGLRRKSRPLGLRAAARKQWLQEIRRGSPILGEVMLLLAKSSMELLSPWQLVRQESLRVLMGVQPELNELMRERGRWLELAGTLQSWSGITLARFESWSARMPSRIAAAILRRDSGLSERRESSMRERRQADFSYWSRQQRATTALIGLDDTAARILADAVKISRDSLQMLRNEHNQLMKELDDVIAWLEEWQARSTAVAFPPPEGQLVSAENRARQWTGQVAALVRSRLAVQVESIVPERALPGRKPHWHQLNAQQALIRNFEQHGRPPVLLGFEEAESGHRELVRDIERAREVAAFSLEAAAAGDDEGRQVAVDGMCNAVTLVSRQRQSAADYAPVAEQGIVNGLALAFHEFHLELEEGRLGFLTHLARQRGTRLLQTAYRLALDGIQAGARHTWNALSGVYRKLLVWAGWAAPSVTARNPVERRDYLGELLRLQAIPKVLPPIYRRLFRLTPLEDARFLVGREAEMAAVAEARTLWESGRAVSIIVVGARGSGKTSLLNCAGSSVFSGLPFIRGQFDHRALTAEAISSFLADLLQTDPAGLDAVLASGKRVIVLEEVERTFLRRIGGFEGLRFLLERMVQTAETTLWILSLNERAFRYLDGILQIGNHFSHRLNAMAVAPEHLRSAILLRHNLSGLRLQFAPPRAFHSKGNRIRRFFGIQKDAEQAFFDALYQQSEGIFRAAFELWQQSIDRVESGVLYMLSPPEENFDSMIDSLTLQDAFTLQAIQQHGSLTAEEHSGVFDCRLESSREQIDRLCAWEIVEADPNNPGFRICPEAGRMVRIALHRQFLL